VTEIQILRWQIKGSIRLSDGECKTLAEIGEKLDKQALQEVAKIVKPDTILAWYSGLIAKTFDNSQERRSPGRPAIERDREASVVRMVGGFIRRWVSDGACCHGLRKQKSRAAECAAENAARCRGRSRGSLPGKAVEQDSHREGALRRGHFRGRIGA